MEDNKQEDVKSSAEYKMISAFYENKSAKRSGVSYMAHINEGLLLLGSLEASHVACLAYCLHPIVQADESLTSFNPTSLDPKVVMTAMEYRNVANRYLSFHQGKETRSAKLSPLEDVNQMLRADKIQNRKDFESHHLGTHPNSDRLDKYFKEWLGVLGVSEEKYQELAALIDD